MSKKRKIEMIKYHIDKIDNSKKFRILCDEGVNPLDFVLLKPMPEELTKRLQQMIDFFDKKQLYYELETVELLIQYISQSDIKIKDIHGIVYNPYN